MMDVIGLSRLQFAATAMFHFLFVPLTLGLSWMVAVMETRSLRKGGEEWRRMAKFWGRLFVINFAVGVVTGLSLEFQFGTNWKNYSIFVGDVFGSLLAIEASVAFFLESTFLAVWIFGWERVSPRLHALAIWIVAAASTVSAFWILCANGFMQRPVGFELKTVDGVTRAVMTDFLALITNEYALAQFAHTMIAALVLSAFFVMGVSAWHIIRRSHEEFFLRSFRFAMYPALIFSLLEVVQGHANGATVARHQPAKLAAMEALWRTHGDGSHTPQTLIIIPNEKEQSNRVEWLRIPDALSILAHHSSEGKVMGLDRFDPSDRPPVTLSFISFRVMLALGCLFPALAALAAWLAAPASMLTRIPLGARVLAAREHVLAGNRRILWVFVLAIPLPHIAIQCGWALAEVGRQPWIVYGVMRTAAAGSPVSAGQVAVSLAGFFVLYSALGALDFVLLFKYARRGPLPAEPQGEA